jgi:short-subunit dehydrogenase
MRPPLLINNAGYGPGGALLDVSDATLHAQFDTNVFGLMAVTRAFAPEMLACERGWIVEALSDALRAELYPQQGLARGALEGRPI